MKKNPLFSETLKVSESEELSFFYFQPLKIGLVCRRLPETARNRRRLAQIELETSWAALVSNSFFNWSSKVLSDFSNFGWWVIMLGIMGDHPWEAGDNILEGDFE